MSEAMKIPDFLKSLPAAASLLNLSILCATSSGELRRNTTVIPTPTTPICADMNEAEEGFMRTSMETLNRPMNGVGGFVLTLRYDAVAKTQIFFGWAAREVVHAQEELISGRQFMGCLEGDSVRVIAGRKEVAYV